MSTKKNQPKPIITEIESMPARSEFYAPTHTIVIPYLASQAKGNELLYAVRAWSCHLPDSKIVIIGDALPWFSKDIVHIPHKPVSTNPQIDAADKLATAIASDLVPDSFIWSNDDIYPVCPLDYEDILVRKAMGYLEPKGTPGGIYAENSKRTLAALKAEKIDPIYDYATHTPMVFEKSKMAETLAKYGCQKEGFLISSLYYNTHFAGKRPIITRNDTQGSIVASVWSSTPNQNVLKQVFETRKFINNNDNGWPHVELYLKDLFPEKSKFEK